MRSRRHGTPPAEDLGSDVDVPRAPRTAQPAVVAPTHRARATARPLIGRPRGASSVPPPGARVLPTIGRRAVRAPQRWYAKEQVHFAPVPRRFTSQFRVNCNAISSLVRPHLRKLVLELLAEQERAGQRWSTGTPSRIPDARVHAHARPQQGSAAGGRAGVDDDEEEDSDEEEESEEDESVRWVGRPSSWVAREELVDAAPVPQPQHPLAPQYPLHAPLMAQYAPHPMAVGPSGGVVPWNWNPYAYPLAYFYPQPAAGWGALTQQPPYGPYPPRHPHDPPRHPHYPPHHPHYPPHFPHYPPHFPHDPPHLPHDPPHHLPDSLPPPPTAVPFPFPPESPRPEPLPEPQQHEQSDPDPSSLPMPLPKPATQQCSAKKHHDGEPCNNPCLLGCWGPPSSCCAQHIDMDPNSPFARCAFISDRGQQRRPTQNCKEVVVKELGVCHKHAKQYLKAYHSGNAPATLAHARDLLERAIRNRDYAQYMTDRTSPKGCDVHQRRTKLVGKLQQLVEQVQDFVANNSPGL